MISPITLSFVLGGAGIFLAGLGVFVWALSLKLGASRREIDGRRSFGR
jgi:hypothetical protein